MMFYGIIDVFDQRRALHNRAGRHSKEAAMPIKSSPRILGAVRALANIPIMHRRPVSAKRSFAHSARTDSSHYTDFCHRRFKGCKSHFSNVATQSTLVGGWLADF